MPTFRLLEGDCLAALAALPEACVDAVVTDPPYGLEFMGKEWDRLGATVERDDDERDSFSVQRGGSLPFDGGGQRVRYGASAKSMQAWHEQWARAALRVLKPGGHLVAFGGTRTHHRLMCALEDAGFEIRDTLLELGGQVQMMAWCFGSGFPKSKNLDGEWAGWGTALKPAWEPIILARRPLAAPTVAGNVQSFGTGALNIDGCRVGIDGGTTRSHQASGWRTGHAVVDLPLGRWPANLVLSHSPTCRRLGTKRVKSDGNFPAQQNTVSWKMGSRGKALTPEASHADPDGLETVDAWACEPGCAVELLDQGEEQPSRFFATFQPKPADAVRFRYTAKADRAEREIGLEGMPKGFLATMGDGIGAREHNPQEPGAWARNTHPTVKPLDLMAWLCRLITPPGGLILDPFAGSGSTGVAALRENFRFLGIEREPEYVAIARARIIGDAPLLNQEVSDVLP